MSISSVSDPVTAPDIPSPETPKPLGRRLVDAGIISDEQLKQALREQKAQETYLGKTLVNLEMLDPSLLAGFLALDAQSCAFGETDWCIEPEVIRLVPYTLAHQYDVLPLHRDRDRLIVAMAAPINTVGIDAVERLTGLRTDAVVAPHLSIIDAIEQQYSRTGLIDDTIQQLTTPVDKPVEDDSGFLAAMTLLCNQIVFVGLQQGATHIHVEPDEFVMRVRLRVLGILREAVVIPMTLHSMLISRLKQMANLDADERHIPQEGSMVFDLADRSIQLHVCTLPTQWGEYIDLKLLATSSIQHPLSSLGLATRDQKTVQSLVARAYGMIVIAGPSGCGKTATLYAALQQINAREKSIVTIEDPIEHRLSWVRQMQVNVDRGLTYSSGLRALLRQNPDVAVIGELRDTETADLAARAASTGHLVLTTLNSNDAIGAVQQLIELGLEPSRVCSTVAAVISQRLVRCICADCKVPDENPDAAFDQLNLTTSKPYPLTLWHGEGCARCSGSGYYGRQAIYEVFILDDAVHGPIVSGPDFGMVRRLAGEKGMRSLVDDGFKKALQGVTTVAEVMRVTSA